MVHELIVREPFGEIELVHAFVLHHFVLAITASSWNGEAVWRNAVFMPFETVTIGFMDDYDHRVQESSLIFLLSPLFSAFGTKVAGFFQSIVMEMRRSGVICNLQFKHAWSPQTWADYSVEKLSWKIPARRKTCG